jgi:ABC-type uncharacterized transport system substrate-binding protein
VFFLLTENAYSGEKDIFLIESYSQEYKWDQDYVKEIKKYLGVKYKIQTFQMNTKVLPKNQHEKIAQFAFEKILKVQPILVILGDDAALKYLGSKLEEKKIKTVYLGINNNPQEYFNQNPNYITGVLERPLINSSGEYIKELIPKAKKILILFDDDVNSIIVQKDFYRKKPNILSSGIEYDFKTVSSYSDWQKNIINAGNNYDAIIVGLYSALLDSNKNNVDSENVIHWTSEKSKIPVFGFWDFSIGKEKAIGGLVTTAESQGKAAAELSLKILSNKNLLPRTYNPIYLQEGIFIFSKSELKNKNLILPPEIEKQSNLID